MKYNTLSPETGNFAQLVINCNTADQGICVLYMPNSFTPNGDGNNDYLQPITYCTFTSYEFLLFNRWGRWCLKPKNHQTNGTVHIRAPGPH